MVQLHEHPEIQNYFQKTMHTLLNFVIKSLTFIFDHADFIFGFFASFTCGMIGFRAHNMMIASTQLEWWHILSNVSAGLLTVLLTALIKTLWPNGLVKIIKYLKSIEKKSFFKKKKKP